MNYGGTSRSTRTFTETTNGVTKKITEETVTSSDGKRTITRTEETLPGYEGYNGEGACSNNDYNATPFAQRFTPQQRGAECVQIPENEWYKANQHVDHGSYCTGPETNATQRNAHCNGCNCSGHHVSECPSSGRPAYAQPGHQPHMNCHNEDQPQYVTYQGSFARQEPQPLDAFRQDALRAHNDKRKQHNVPPFTMSHDLNDHAQHWAEHLTNIGALQNSSCTLPNGDRIGENSASKWSSVGADYTGQEVTDYWYHETGQYDSYGKEPQGCKSGHFTQIVWLGSREFGIGKAFDGKGSVIVVGSYRPPGNVLGQFSHNVVPPSYRG